MTPTANQGLFPLGLVLLPGEEIPLHIFEPRYRALFADCVLDDRAFVMVLSAEEGVAKVGCTARFVGLARRFSDGRMNVTVRGEERVEIVEQTSGELYLTAQTASLPDEAGLPDLELETAVRERFDRIAEQVAGSAYALDGADRVGLAYAVAGAMELDAAIKQTLLETREETDRLTQVDELLRTTLAQLDRQKVAADRAQSNGKVHHD